MILFISLLSFFVGMPLILLLFVMFYFSDKRQLNMKATLQTNEEMISLINKNLLALQKNDETLSKNIQTLANAYRKKKKEIRRS
jgi:hypothetical protein